MLCIYPGPKGLGENPVGESESGDSPLSFKKVIVETRDPTSSGSDTSPASNPGRPCCNRAPRVPQKATPP